MGEILTLNYCSIDKSKDCHTSCRSSNIDTMILHALARNALGKAEEITHNMMRGYPYARRKLIMP